MASNYELERRLTGTCDVVAEFPVRAFVTGATRNADAGRPDPEGFISPWVLERFSEYMNKNRLQPDGNVRASDNWQLGIPREAYMKSKVRHMLTTWQLHRGGMDSVELEESLCAELFNTMGYLHELLKERGYGRATQASTKEVCGNWTPSKWEEAEAQTRKGSGGC